MVRGLTTSATRQADGTTTFDCLGSHEDPTVVFVHAALLDRRMWHPTMSRLALRPARRVHAIAYDLRGHGGSAHERAITGVGQLAEDLLALLDNLSLDAVHLVGASLGGAVAQHLTAKAPERVRSLTLVGTAACFPGQPLLDRAASFNPGNRAAAVDETLRRWFGPDGAGADDDATAYARLLLGDVDQSRWQATWTALAGYRIPRSASRHDVPVLALVGDRDSSTPPRATHDLCGLYRTSRHRHVEGAAHMLALQHPDEVARAVSTQLQDPPPSSASPLLHRPDEGQ